MFAPPALIPHSMPVSRIFNGITLLASWSEVAATGVYFCRQAEHFEPAMAAFEVTFEDIDDGPDDENPV
jgi:hypothetical protein